MLRTGGDGIGLVLNFVKDVLLETVKKNRDKHVKDFEAALSAYRSALVEILEAKLAAARENKKVLHHISLPVPECYVEEYDRAISMLELCSDSTIQLSDVLYRQLVEDRWEWKREFSETVIGYAKKSWNLGAKDSDGV